MKEYRVVYLLGDKTKKKVTYEARNKVEAKKKAINDGLNVVSVSENIGAGINQFGEKYLPSMHKLKPKQIIDFFSQLVFMLEADILIHHAIRNLHRGAKNQQYRKFLNKVMINMEHGSQLSQSLTPDFGFLPEIQMQVEAGEKSGNVAGALRTIIQRMEMDMETKSKITKQLYYPAIVILVMVFVVNYILTNVVPGLAQLLIENGGDLPAITIFLINTSEFMSQYGSRIFLGIACLCIVFVLLKRNKRTGVYIDRFILKIPLIGNVILKMNISRYYYVAANMMKGHLLLPTAMRIASDSLSNTYIRQRLSIIPSEMERSGKPLDELMRDIYLTNDYAELVSTGLVTGQTGAMFDKIANATMQEANDKVKMLVSMIEPVITIVIGGCVAVIVMALFMPMFSLIDAF